MGPLITYQSLCMDAHDPQRLGGFWADALGLSFHLLPDGNVRLDGEEPWRTVWIDRVPEPRTVKHRVHLDVHGDVDSFLTLGATTIDDSSFDWAILADPEGGEFCVFPEGVQARPRLIDLVIDSADPPALASWWGEAFGVQAATAPIGATVLRGVPDSPFAIIGFMPVPEPKRVKNRLHIDVDTRSLAELIDHGATLLRPQDDEIEWNIMADPEGNEFCAFTS